MRVDFPIFLRHGVYMDDEVTKALKEYIMLLETLRLELKKDEEGDPAWSAGRKEFAEELLLLVGAKL